MNASRSGAQSFLLKLFVGKSHFILLWKFFFLCKIQRVSSSLSKTVWELLERDGFNYQLYTLKVNYKHIFEQFFFAPGLNDNLLCPSTFHLKPFQNTNFSSNSQSYLLIMCYTFLFFSIYYFLEPFFASLVIFSIQRSLYIWYFLQTV